MVPAVEYAHQAVGVIGQVRHVPELRIVATGVEMWRAVPIGKFFRAEGMRNQAVDAPYKQMIRYPFHRLQAFIPTVSAECLAHGAPVFVGCQVRCRSAQLGQGKMSRIRRRCRPSGRHRDGTACPEPLAFR